MKTIKYVDLVPQRIFVLNELRKGKRTTIDFRAVGICSPASRISELRKNGYEISTNYCFQYDHVGIKHRIGVYTLISEPERIEI